MEPQPVDHQHTSIIELFSDQRPILVFNGKCILCSGFVQFILHRDRRRKIRFLVAQSATGALSLSWFILRLGSFRLPPFDQYYPGLTLAISRLVNGSKIA